MASNSESFRAILGPAHACALKGHSEKLVRPTPTSNSVNKRACVNLYPYFFSSLRLSFPKQLIGQFPGNRSRMSLRLEA